MKLKYKPDFEQARNAWNHYWAWGAMPLVLSGAFFLSASSLSLLTNVGIYMLLALGLNITVGMTGLLGFTSGYHAMMDCDVLLVLGSDRLGRHPQLLPAVAVGAGTTGLSRLLNILIAPTPKKATPKMKPKTA